MNYLPHMLTVVTQDPRFGGGAAAQTDAFVAGARALGREPRVLWVPHPTFDGRRLTLDRIEPLRQVRGGRRLAAEVREPAWVVATMATAGYGALAANAEYDCWLGTTVDDEWRGRQRGLSLGRRAAFEAGRPFLRRVERDVLGGARRLYATSRGSRAAVARAAAVPETQVALLPIPVDTEAFAPEPDDVWTARLDRPVLAFVGRAWDPRKNVSLLLEALPLIPGAIVRLIGEPPRGPLPEGVEATGPVQSVAEHLRTASLFVLPSHQEGFGIVAAEALAAGVPVLSTRSGGPEELLEASGGGRLLASFDPEELAAAAAELLGDVDTLTAMRRRGRAYVEQEHAPAVFRERLADALGDTT